MRNGQLQLTRKLEEAQENYDTLSTHHLDLKNQLEIQTVRNNAKSGHDQYIQFWVASLKFYPVNIDLKEPPICKFIPYVPSTLIQFCLIFVSNQVTSGQNRYKMEQTMGQQTKLIDDMTQVTPHQSANDDQCPNADK